MNYAHPQLLRHLAAEYVLGTLRGPARRRFESLMQQRQEAREHVDFWEFRLSEFGQAVAPVCPPAATREALLRRATPVPAAAPLPVDGLERHPRPAVSQRRSARRRRRWLTAAASVIALAAAFLIGQNNPSIPPQGRTQIAEAPLAAVTPTPVAAPVASVVPTEPHSAEPELYLAQLKLPASSMGWLLSLSRDHRRLSVVAADDLLTLGRHTLQLWWISPDRGPVPLAMLPAERDKMTVIDLPAEVLRGSHITFAVSMEPEGGSRSGKPSGPVLSATPQLDTI